jgi:sulfoxide reductase catalytic subunit YedY
MADRRGFLWRLAAGLAAAGLGLWARPAGAVRRRVLPSHTKATELARANPRAVDPRNLEITPLSEFDTMGQVRAGLDPETWRLEVGGAVERPGSWSLAKLKSRPVVERKVLLICPGVFSFYARWRGLSLAALLAEAGPRPGAREIEIAGPPGQREKVERFTLEEVRAGEVFLAYGVNGEPLPEKHGFPLRVVAGLHYGDDWVKYVHRVTVLEPGA